MVVMDEVVDWICAQVSAEGTVADMDMGELELAVGRAAQEAQRQALQRLVQETAAVREFGCPACGRALNVVDHRRRREVVTSFGLIGYTRSYGLCPHCQSCHFPADVALGVEGRSRSSPRLQEICAAAALRAPAGQAEEDVRRLTGLRISASTLYREAQRQGERAIALRRQDEQLTETADGVKALAARAPDLPSHSTMVIMLDAWNIRERDQWGETEDIRKSGDKVERWHWVYTGTVFRLDQRYTKESGRPAIADRGFVATREGLESFKRQLHAEVLQRGLEQAQTVLVVGDGAAWIWNLADEKFKGADQRLDLFHAKQHLWDLAGELYGPGSAEATAWVRPYLDWLDKRQDGAADVIRSLEDLQSAINTFGEKQNATLVRETAYFTGHKDRMDYKSAKKKGQPCGSGAIESTCSQYQRRFKLTGQFWTLAGDEALLALATLHRNRRWHRLFPHDTAPP
jgi:hypothetical protein